MHKAALYESLQGCSLQTQKDICFTLYTRIGSSGTPFIMVNDQQCPVCPVGKQQTPLFKTVEQTARRICSLITIKRKVKKMIVQFYRRTMVQYVACALSVDSLLPPSHQMQ